MLIGGGYLTLCDSRTAETGRLIRVDAAGRSVYVPLVAELPPPVRLLASDEQEFDGNHININPDPRQSFPLHLFVSMNSPVGEFARQTIWILKRD